MEKRILGIDPGTVCAGFAVLEKNGSKIDLKLITTLDQKSKDLITNRVGRFYEFCAELIVAYKITDIAIETAFLGKNAQNFLKLGYLRGVINLLCYQHKLNLVELTPRQIKQYVTSYGHADKDQVARAMLFFVPALRSFLPQKTDATDSLAIAFCGAMLS